MTSTFGSGSSSAATAGVSGAQRRHWLLWRMANNQPTTAVAAAVRVATGLDTQSVGALMEDVIARYPILGQRYHPDEPSLIEGTHRAVLVPRTHRASLGEDLEQAVAGAARDLTSSGFDLSREPPVRVAVVHAGRETALLIAAHPIAADAPSLEIVLRDLLSRLDRRVTLPDGEGQRRGETGDAGDATGQSPVIDDDAARGPASDAARKYFSEMLRDAPESLDLPTDRVRPPVFDPRASHTHVDLPPELARALLAAASEWTVSPRSILVAVLANVIGRYTRANETVLGIVNDARPVGGERLVGPFQNSLPLLLAQKPESTGRALASAAEAALEQLRHHQRLPFASLLDHLGLAPDPARSPLFQVSFQYDDRSQTDDGLSLVPAPVGLVDCDLAVAVRRRGDQIGVDLTFPSALFEPQTVQRLAGHVLTLLTSVLASPDAAISRLSLLPARERDWILSVAGVERRMASERSVLDLIRSHTRATPGAIAVSWNATETTYGALDRRANQVAHALRRRGVGADARVAVLMDRSSDLIAVLLGIWKAGAAYVPIEPANPPDRIGFVLGDCGAAVLIVDRSLSTRLAQDAPPLPTIWTEPGLAGFDDEATSDPEIPIAATSLAYVIYTSGSTGVPKGVMVEHRQVSRLFDATAAWYGFDQGDVWTMFHSVAFDFSVWEIWGALAYGGRLVVVPYAVSRSPEDFYRLLADQGVTILNQTPSAFRALIAAEQGLGALPLALRFVIFGGEALPFESLRPWFDRHGDEQPRLVNMYGITETTVHVTYRPIHRADLDRPGGASLIGRPIPDLSTYVVDEHLELCPVGVPGELLVGGDGVARGYLDRPELTAARFIADDFSGRAGTRLYRTGDLARLLSSGELDYLGRIDHQVKIRGFRIELGEIEAVLRRGGAVRDVAVLPYVRDRETLLVAYTVSDRSAAELREIARGKLPEYMVPSYFVSVEAIATTTNGKVDRRALPSPIEASPAGEAPQALPAGRIEEVIAAVWREVLGVAEVDAERSFFEVGGTSVAVVQVATLLRARLNQDVPVVMMFQHPSIRALAHHLEQARTDSGAHAHKDDRSDGITSRLRGTDALRSGFDEPIAIIGLAGRFPGANDVDALWRNLVGGIDSISVFSADEIDPSVSADLLQDPAYVPARGVLEDASLFDPGFFGITPREAEVIDPQQRVMLEIAWESLERAGYDPRSFPGSIGVYCGEFNDTYYTENVLRRPDVVEAVGAFAAMVGNEKDFIATRIAHRLGLRGPALSLHTACSTSLVSVAQAFWALRTGQCDMALAGGAAVTSPQKSGHLYQEGAMLSADGRTRTFDAAATGTVFSDGAGMVVLRRLSDAVAAGDHIHAIIRGVATNNDGADKMSFSAPSIDGQAACVRAALDVAGVSADDVSYVEAHGTATPLGDPVEIEALRQAFGAHTRRRQYCAIGSIKSNLGHLTAASGAAGLIKTALALENEQIPPSLHFDHPNPKIDFAATPFFVQSRLADWPRSADTPRRAGVSSFGVGGTNAHVVVEEAPTPPPPEPGRPRELLVLSAKTPTALDGAQSRLADFFDRFPDVSVADVAYTLQMGRRSMSHRRSVVVATPTDAARALRGSLGGSVARSSPPGIAFAFPGQGSQVVGMGRELYAWDPGFRETVDRCSKLLSSELDRDLREVLFTSDAEAGATLLRQTRFTQPALFTIEYALAQLWIRAGVRPQTMLGHSVGEFVAAVLAEVIPLEGALRLVAARGRLMQALPPGAMLSVRARASDLALPAGVDLAAVNAPQLCVVAGPDADIDRYAAVLDKQGVTTSRLHTSHAFHSAMMDPIVDKFAELVRRVPLSAPKQPFVSSVTAQTITNAQATDPLYWARHVRATVRFADALTRVWTDDPDRVILEVGPRSVATVLARQTAADPKRQLAVASLEGPPGGNSEWGAWLSAVGQLWALGATIDWATVHGQARRRRVPLPTYAWDHKPYWLDPVAGPAQTAETAETAKTAKTAETAMTAPTAMEQLVAEQLDLMARQLDILTNPGDA